MARTIVCKENNSGSSKHAGITIVPEVCPVRLVRVWERKAEDEMMSRMLVPLKMKLAVADSFVPYATMAVMTCAQTTWVQAGGKRSRHLSPALSSICERKELFQHGNADIMYVR